MKKSDLGKEIELIKLRNSRVEMDKAWEVSKTRKFCIVIVTYFIMVLFMYALKIDRIFINAIIPTAGFVISTFSVSLVKNIWVKSNEKKD